MQPLPQVRFATRFQPGPRSCSSIPEPVRRRSRSSSGWETPRREGLQPWCSERPISSVSPRSAARFSMSIRPVLNWWDLPAPTMHCGFTCSISFHHGTEGLWKMRFWPLVLRMGRWKGELDLRHFGSGIPIPFQIDCFRIDDPRTGEPMNVATVGRDLSAQKNSEAALLHMNDTLERRVEERTFELAEANKRLVAEKLERAQIDLRFQNRQNDLFLAARLTAAAQMAAALAHEISQPLTAVVNSINAAKRLLARGDQLNMLAALEVANEASEQALRASEIVRSLRQLVSRGETEKRIEELPSMIEEASALVLNSVTPLALRLRFEFDDKAREVWVNRVQIQQVIVNLVRNAFEAMANQEPREVTLATKALDDSMIEIAVADIGPGTHGDMAGQLFRPFVSNKHDGMGLGLSISRSIIEAHDGQLTMEPNPGGGTIFRFSLPSCGAAHGE